MSDSLSDHEMTKLCAEALGYTFPNGQIARIWINEDLYDPLSDDAQAMALVKRFRMTVEGHKLDGREWWNAKVWGDYSDGIENSDLNRAIVECAARVTLHKDE